MNPKRKADLQRRLSMASVPKPPTGLAERIKSDIPELLATTRERERLSRTMGFNLRVAASILLLVSSAYVCLRLLSRAVNERVPVAAGAPRMAPVQIADATTRVPQPQRAVEAMPPPPQQTAAQRMNDNTSSDERAVATPSTDQPVQVAQAAPPPPAPPPPPAAPEPLVTRRQEVTSAAAAAPPAEAPVVPRRDAREMITVTAEAPALFAKPAATPEGANTPAAEKTASARAKTMDGIVGGVVGSITPRSANAADFSLAARNEVFGISTDPHAFDRVKEAIERGERPHSVNVEGLINYFAGAPRHSPREVSLDVEASPAPLNVGAHTFVVRMTVDTARAELPYGASVPPVATDVRLDVELEPEAVVSHHRVGAESDLDSSEATLLKNVSATALFGVELRSNLPWRQRVATIRLHYRSVASGRQRTITRVVHASDFARSWPEASTRHRLASLGAVWGETLKNAPGANDVARRAEELANQEPKDLRARELAKLASASSRLQSSGPTGSGR
jgi:outer membrane biosynthesis protein TonB